MAGCRYRSEGKLTETEKCIKDDLETKSNDDVNILFPICLFFSDPKKEEGEFSFLKQ